MCKLRFALLGVVAVLLVGAVWASNERPSTRWNGGVLRGVTLVSWWHGEYSSPQAARALEDIAALRANWVALTPTGYQADARTAPGPADHPQKTPTHDDLRAAINRARDLGLKVLLKPHVDLEDGRSWRGEIGRDFDREDWVSWFTAYRAWLLAYAILAQEQGVEAFCVGTELSAASRRTADWRSLIAAVRGVYDGPLVYAANWSGEEHVAFWDALDWIGVDAYYPLSRSPTLPTVRELADGWAAPCRGLELLARRWGRPVVLTELGFRSAGGAWKEPWRWDTVQPADPETQSRLYQAAALALGDRPWLAGIFLWAWETNGRGGPSDAGYTPAGKPSQAILRAAFQAVEQRAHYVRAMSFGLRPRGL